MAIPTSLPAVGASRSWNLLLGAVRRSRRDREFQTPRTLYFSYFLAKLLTKMRNKSAVALHSSASRSNWFSCRASRRSSNSNRMRSFAFRSLSCSNRCLSSVSIEYITSNPANFLRLGVGAFPISSSYNSEGRLVANLRISLAACFNAASRFSSAYFFSSISSIATSRDCSRSPYTSLIPLAATLLRFAAHRFLINFRNCSCIVLSLGFGIHSSTLDATARETQNILKAPLNFPLLLNSLLHALRPT